MKTYSKEFIKELENRVFWEGSPYHDPRFLLSYNRIFIGDMSGRGIGKSTSWKAVLLLHWMRKQDGINLPASSLSFGGWIVNAGSCLMLMDTGRISGSLCLNWN